MIRRGNMSANLAPDEDSQQIALAAYLDRRGFLWCHVPNGGKRGKKTAAKMKRMGVKKGVPDILIFNQPIHTFNEMSGLAIEMKNANRTGRASDEQKQWLADLRARGWATAVCHGYDEAKKVIEEHYGS